ncbi:hypothetical protein PV326_004676, partial [Microctonus aethiopoides]
TSACGPQLCCSRPHNETLPANNQLRLFNSSHYGSANIPSNLSPSNLNLGGLAGSMSPTGANMSACMVQSATSGVTPTATGMGHHHVTPHSPSEAKSGYPYLGGIDSQVCGRVH